MLMFFVVCIPYIFRKYRYFVKTRFFKTKAMMTTDLLWPHCLHYTSITKISFKNCTITVGGKSKSPLYHVVHTLLWPVACGLWGYCTVRDSDRE